MKITTILLSLTLISAPSFAKKKNTRKNKRKIAQVAMETGLVSRFEPLPLIGLDVADRGEELRRQIRETKKQVIMEMKQRCSSEGKRTLDVIKAEFLPDGRVSNFRGNSISVEGFCS